MATGYTFGARPQQYPMGSIKPTGGRRELDAVVKAAYDKWKAAYVMAACDGYVVKTASGTTSSSALGNGMIITAMMAGHDPQAQTIFDGMFAVGRKFPSGLSVSVPAKHGIGPRPGNEYLARAYAVGANCSRVQRGRLGPGRRPPLRLRADPGRQAVGLDRQGQLPRRGEEDRQRHQALRHEPAEADRPRRLGVAARRGHVDHGGHAPNYFMVGYFHAYAKASGDMYWMQAVDAVQTPIADVQTRFSAHDRPAAAVPGRRHEPAGRHLPARRQRAATTSAAPACIPLWLASDYIGSGDMRSKAALTKITDWLKTKTGGDATKIVDGYRLNGDAIGTTGTMAFVAPFGAIAIFDAANQAWLDSIWKLMSAAPTASQAADTANLLGMLMVTGNWWQPCRGRPKRSPSARPPCRGPRRWRPCGGR